MSMGIRKTFMGLLLASILGFSGCENKHRGWLRNILQQYEATIQDAAAFDLEGALEINAQITDKDGKEYTFDRLTSDYLLYEWNGKIRDVLCLRDSNSGIRRFFWLSKIRRVERDEIIDEATRKREGITSCQIKDGKVIVKDRAVFYLDDGSQHSGDWVSNKNWMIPPDIPSYPDRISPELLNYDGFRNGLEFDKRKHFEITVGYIYGSKDSQAKKIRLDRIKKIEMHSASALQILDLRSPKEITLNDGSIISSDYAKLIDFCYHDGPHHGRGGVTYHNRLEDRCEVFEKDRFFEGTKILDVRTIPLEAVLEMKFSGKIYGDGSREVILIYSDGRQERESFYLTGLNYSDDGYHMYPCQTSNLDKSDMVFAMQDYGAILFPVDLVKTIKFLGNKKGE